jgi:hypothetical protein
MSWTVKKHLLPDKTVFSYQDCPSHIFQLFNGWAWDKLYLASFVKQHELYFQNLRTSNDMLFTYLSLVKASSITVLDKILVVQRVNINSSLANTREKSWDCFYLALTALKDALIKMGIFEAVEQSFTNWALNFTLWNLNTISGVTFDELFNTLKDKWFEELGIASKSKEFFYSDGEYKQFKNIMDSDLTVYLREENKKLKTEIQQLKTKLNSMPVQPRKELDSRSYKIGRAITYLPRKARKLLRKWRKK